MKKKFVRLISAVLSAAMTLTAVPLSAFAEGEAHTHDGESNVITTPLDFREKTADENGVGWSWDHDTKKLTLDGVNIQATTEENMMSVVTVPDGTEIVLKGENNIVQTDTGESYTYVLSAVNNQEVNCDGTMTISGDGVLNAENRSTDSMACSLGGTIIINGGTVNATGKVVAESLEIHNDGALNAEASAVSNDGAAVGVKRGITVDGNGSLTAVGGAVENEYVNNGAILLNSNFGDKISVSGNGSITVPEGNAAKVGIYYDGNKSIDAEISGGKVTAYGTKCGIYKVNLIMSGTGSVYATGGTYGIGQTVPTIDKNRFTVKGSTEFGLKESAVTGEVKLPDGYYYIGEAYAKTVVIKPDTSPRIILGKQIGRFTTHTEQTSEWDYQTFIDGSASFDITLKNISDEEFANAQAVIGNDSLYTSITKNDYGWKCTVSGDFWDEGFETTDISLYITLGETKSNTVAVKMSQGYYNGLTHMYVGCVGYGSDTSVFYTNAATYIKDIYCLRCSYNSDGGTISRNWYVGDNCGYTLDTLGTVDGEKVKISETAPKGKYAVYCDTVLTREDGSEAAITNKFEFEIKECLHENGFDSYGKCKDCKAKCTHDGNIDINTGKCNKCEHRFVATISTDGNAPTGYDTLADCLDSVTADTGNYVKIYQDIEKDSSQKYIVKYHVTLDLNGHRLDDKLEINEKNSEDNNGELTLTGTGYIDNVYAYSNTTFTIDDNANIEADTFFNNAGTRFTVSDGANVTVRYLAVKESISSEGNATSVKLATGMKITEMLAYDLDKSSPLSENIMLKNLLSDNQMLKYESSSKIIDLYYGASRIIINSELYGYGTITIVEHTDADHKYSSETGACKECGKPCEHGGDINTDTGICSICGAVVSVAIYTDANGISKYVDTDELHSLLNEYGKSGTVKLFKDYYKIERHDIDGVITIDLNGHDFTVRGVTPWSGGKVTFKNSGSEQVTCSGSVSPTVDAPGGTLIVDGDIYFDSAININDYGTVILNAGKYVDLTIKGDRTLCDMLGEGKAFFDANGNVFNASVQAGSDLTVKDHSHTYVDGKCDCGYVCPHSDVDSKTGKCTECEYQYAAVIVKDGAVASVYEENEMGAAFEAADSDANTGCTLRVYKNYTGSYTTLSGKFTLWIAEKANVGTLTVSGDITVTGSGKNNSIYGDFNVAAGGKLTFDENCGAMGTVSVGAGTFDCYYSLYTTLNINDASSNVILHGGYFIKIRYNGGGDRANAEILTLLAENRMFMTRSNDPIDGSKTLLKDGFATTVLVIPHEGHGYDSTTGKCTICGKRCGHTDVDSKTGMCKTCKHEFVATLTVGDKVTGFASLSDCLSNTSEDGENYVKIYQDIGDAAATAALDTIDVNHNVMIDLNGHKLYYIELNVNNDNGAGNLTLTGSEGSYISQVDVCGGRTFKIDSDANINFNAIFVEAGARFGVSYGANVTVNTLVVKESLTLYGSTTTSVRLTTGMRIGTLMYDLDRNSGSGNLLLYSLLGEGKALQYDNSGEYVDIYEKFTSKIIRDSFTVVYHYEHSYDKATGKCDCGYVCPHSDVDSKTGVCSICEYQFTAGISGVGTAKYFDNIGDAFTAALSAENNGCTLTLYKDCELSQNIVIGNATVTVDMNGHSILLAYRIKVNDGGVLYLKNSRENGSIDTEIEVNKGGTLINGTADDSRSAVSVFGVTADAAKRVEIYGGSYEGLTVNNGTSGIALYGGSYESINTNDLTDSTPVSALLAKGYAFATLNSVTHLPESIVDGSATTLNPGLKNVTVVKHTHTYTEANTKCACGVCALAIFTETTQSSETYTFIESATQFKNIAENEADGVLKLTGDVDCIVKGIIINGNKTIDMNGHTLNVSVGTEEISAVAVYGNVTFENSGSSRAVINATGVYSYGMVTVNGDIEFDTFATFEDGDALINAGVFKSIYVQGRSVIEILGSGKALASESGEILNASVQQIYKAGNNMFVTAHPKHTYDDHGNCACGYKCLHDGEGQVDEDSANKVCSECGAKIYAKVTTADGKVKYFDDITEGLRYADKAENKGCTLKMLRDFFDRNTDINVNGGELTVDMNGFGVYINSFNGSRTQITIRSDSKCTFGVENGFSMDGGTVTFSGEVSVVCQNVKLNATYFSSCVETLKIDTLILEDGVLLKQLASITNANIANIDCSSEIYLYQILASGSRVDSQLYSDLKANASSNFDNVRIIRCDHPDGVGRDNRCIYCNSLIAASVSYTENGAEKTEYFVKEDLGKAFAKANSVASATITMLMSSAYDTDYLPVTGDVTLIANGDNAILYNTVKVADGGKLTLRGNANIFAVIAEPGSRLTAEEATRIAYLTVNGGDVKLSGGQYDNITVKDGKITDILGNGYAYKKTEGGAWLTLKEREVSEASGVTVAKAPIVQATLSTEINKLYRNSNANPTLKFNLALAHGSNLNDSYVSKRYGINSYESGDIIYSSLSALVKDAKLSADEIIDKAGDSDVAKIYFVVTTGDGYEIKSNAVSIDLVDCDHSQVVDPTADKETAGNITEPTYCEICESKFNAKITKGDDVRYYNDLDEATKDAQKSENEGCTLYPLYNKNGYGGQLVITEGNFTLKYAVRTAFSRPIIINGNVKLTVTGRCAVTEFENQDAFIVRGGDVTFEGLATGSNVTINGGNVTMTGNNINCLTINGGNVSISSGGFAEIITKVSNKVIADYIDPGFWVQDRGTKEWIDIYSLNKATASSTNVLSVRLCPMQIIKPIDTVYYTNGYYPGDIPSLEISAVPWYSDESDANVAYQWIAIDENGNETEIEGATDRKLSLENLTTGRYYCRLTYSNATTAGVSMVSDVVTATITECEHSGGEATCTNKAKCEICGAEYGETKPHSYTQIKSPEYLKSAATCTAKAVYYTSCADCGQSSKGTKNEATFEYGNALGHKYGEWVSNGDGTHTRVCANDNKHTETKACHGGKATCTAKAICEDCGKAYGEMAAHTFTVKTASAKYLKSAATCTAKAVYYTSCADCGLSSKGTKNEATFEYGNALGHKYGEWVSNGDGTHTRVCANDNKHTETKACHGGKATCTAKAICEDCGKAYGEMTAHTFTAKSTISRYLKRAATCTEKSEYYVSCAGCGLSSKGTASEAVFTGSALGHSLTEWNVITEVTCTTNGTQERHCTRCDYKQTRTIVAKGHSYGLWNVTKKVGCITDGEQSRECSVCGNKETKTIAATGVHSYGSWKVAKAATCTTTGTKVRSCSECGAKETVILQPTGHKYVESTVKPTYTEKGYTLHKCSECGTSYKSSYTDKLVLASVSGVKLAGRAADALRISWNRNASADGYIVEIYKDGAWSRAGKIMTDSTTDFRVTGLKASTFYKFRVKAYKMSGNTAVYSDYGTTLTARTNPSVIKGAKLAGRAADALRISWDRNTSADGYIVEIYKDGAWSRAVKTTNNSITTYKAEGLKASTVYKLRVRAYKMDGTAAYYGNYSAEVTARTNPSVIKGAKLAGRAADALRISWERNTSADGYIVEIYKDGAWSRAGKITTDSTTDFRVTGLKASTVYKLRVRAYKMSGTVAYYGNYSAEVTARTNPSVMTGVKIGGTAKDALRINWSKNTSAQGYIVEMAQNGEWVRVAKITDNSTTTFRKAGLAKNTSYRFRVCAYHMSGSTPLYGTYVSVSGKTAAN